MPTVNKGSVHAQQLCPARGSSPGSWDQQASWDFTACAYGDGCGGGRGRTEAHRCGMLRNPEPSSLQCHVAGLGVSLARSST